MVALKVLAVTFTYTVGLVGASWSYADTSCDADGKKDILNLELGYTFDMANTAAAQFTSTNDPQNLFRYYNDFISATDRKNKVPMQTMWQIFTNVALMLDTKNPNTAYPFTITCNGNTSGCKGKGFWAHMNDATKRMNFCNPFFDTGKAGGKNLIGTEDATGYCEDTKNQLNLRTAQWSRSAVIVHECTHTSYAMAGLGAAVDYAYGFNGNYLLPRGLFDRSCVAYAQKEKVLCPVSDSDSAKEGFCSATTATNNADTYSFIAAGIYYSNWCPGPIEYPELPKIPSKRAMNSRNPRTILKRSDCPADDYIWWDGTSSE